MGVGTEGVLAQMQLVRATCIRAPCAWGMSQSLRCVCLIRVHPLSQNSESEPAANRHLHGRNPPGCCCSQERHPLYTVPTLVGTRSLGPGSWLSCRAKDPALRTQPPLECLAKAEVAMEAARNLEADLNTLEDDGARSTASVADGGSGKASIIILQHRQGLTLRGGGLQQRR